MKKILFVFENRLVRDSLIEMLRSKYVIVGASCVEEAVNLLAPQKFDLLIVGNRFGGIAGAGDSIVPMLLVVQNTPFARIAANYWEVKVPGAFLLELDPMTIFKDLEVALEQFFKEKE